MPDGAPGPTENILDQLIGKHFDFHGLALVVYSLLVCCVLNVIIVRSLGQSHLTTRLAEHGRVGGPAHDRHNAHAQRLQLEPQGF